MALGPMGRGPRPPQGRRMDIMGIISMPCSRDDYLAERDMERMRAKEMDKCYKRRHKAGYETIDNMRYGGE